MLLQNTSVTVEGTNLNVYDSQWADVNLFAGCLKMYFQELPEPLFTYHMYSQFIDVISKSITLYYVSNSMVVLFKYGSALK